MQQTEKYKLNLIESSDPFLPDGLNANTRKVEEVLSENLGTMQGAVDTLDQRLAAAEKNLGTGGKNCRIVWGSYVGTGTYGKNAPNQLTLDFYPVLMFSGSVLFMRGRETASGSNGSVNVMTWSDNGISWYSSSSASAQFNTANFTFFYVVIGYDKTAEEA